MAVPVGLNPALELCQLGIGLQFSPTAQVEFRLRLMRQQFNREPSHTSKL
jgi:hypothetical protein